MFNLNHTAHLGNEKTCTAGSGKNSIRCVARTGDIVLGVNAARLTLRNKCFAQKAECYAESSGNQNH